MFITIRLSQPLSIFERHNFFGHTGSGQREVTFHARNMKRRDYEALCRDLYLSYQKGYLYGGHVQIIAVQQRLVEG